MALGSLTPLTSSPKNNLVFGWPRSRDPQAFPPLSLADCVALEASRGESAVAEAAERQAAIAAAEAGTQTESQRGTQGPRVGDKGRNGGQKLGRPQEELPKEKP